MHVSSFKTAHRLITGQQALHELPSQASKLGMQKPLLVTDRGVRESGTLDLVTSRMKDLDYAIYDRVPPEPEIEIVEECTQVFRHGGHDGLIAVGGGSAMDIAKSVSVYARHNNALETLFGEDKSNHRECL